MTEPKLKSAFLTHSPRSVDITGMRSVPFYKQEIPSEALLQAPSLGTLDWDPDLLTLSLEQKKAYGLEV